MLEGFLNIPQIITKVSLKLGYLNLRRATKVTGCQLKVSPRFIPNVDHLRTLDLEFSVRFCPAPGEDLDLGSIVATWQCALCGISCQDTSEMSKHDDS